MPNRSVFKCLLVGHKNIETTRGYIQSKKAIEDAVAGRIFAALVRDVSDVPAHDG